MANLYGVANPNPLPVYANCIGNVSVACPAGSETNCIALAVNAALDNGFYYPYVTGIMGIFMGATPPTALTLGARIGAGADFTSFSIHPQVLPANGVLMMSFTLFGFSAIVQNPYAATTFNISLNPTAQAVTALFPTSFAYGMWWRAPDQ